jgi:hypothetical protein
MLARTEIPAPPISFAHPRLGPVAIDRDGQLHRTGNRTNETHLIARIVPPFLTRTLDKLRAQQRSPTRSMPLTSILGQEVALRF